MLKSYTETKYIKWQPNIKSGVHLDIIIQPNHQWLKDHHRHYAQEN